MSRLVFVIITVCALFTIYTPAHSQTADSQTQSEKISSNDANGAKNVQGFERIISSFEFWLSITVVIFTVLILYAEFYLFTRAPHITFQPDDVLRVVITTIIVCGTLFFLAAGFSSEQIAPAIGLFGTVAGYLLGSTEKRKASQADGSVSEAKDEK